MGEPLQLFFWREQNFGDRLNELLLPHYGIPITPSDSAEDADVIGLGSILNFVPPTFDGTILGAGFMWKHQRRRFAQADIHVVRGRLTAERCHAPQSVTLGDPGLLLRPLAPSKFRPRYALGLIPHHTDRHHPALAALQRRFGSEALIVDVRDPPECVVASIAQCSAIASSALHGLVAADALGIPSAWVVLGDGVQGRGFKFPDYFSAFAPDDRMRKPRRVRGDESLSRLLRWMVKPAAAVQDTTARLDKVFRGLSVGALKRAPDRVA